MQIGDIKWKETTCMWLNSLNASSRSRYIKCIQNFEGFCKKNLHLSPVDNFRNYLFKLHNEENLACTTLWSLYSIIGKFFQIENGINLDKDHKFVSNLIKQWGKDETVKKSKVSNFHFQIHKIIVYIIGTIKGRNSSISINCTR